jgi:hypothetical protein
MFDFVSIANFIDQFTTAEPSFGLLSDKSAGDTL